MAILQTQRLTTTARSHVRTCGSCFCGQLRCAAAADTGSVSALALAILYCSARIVASLTQPRYAHAHLKRPAPFAAPIPPAAAPTASGGGSGGTLMTAAFFGSGAGDSSSSSSDTDDKGDDSDDSDGGGGGGGGGDAQAGSEGPPGTFFTPPTAGLYGGG